MKHRKYIIYLLFFAIMVIFATACGKEAAGGRDDEVITAEPESTPTETAESNTVYVGPESGKSADEESETGKAGVEEPENREKEGTESDEKASDVTATDTDSYTFVCADENNDPVEGVRIQICTDEMCVMRKSDEEGKVVFDGEPQIYTIHVFSYPEEYELTSPKDFDTDDKYGTYSVIFDCRE